MSKGRQVIESVYVDAVMFDLDGTLLLSEAASRIVWRRWAESLGLNAEDVIASSYGRRTIDTVRMFAPAYADADREVTRIRRFEATETEVIPALAGAKDLLNSIPDGRWAVVTSNTRELAFLRLERVGIAPPEVLVSSDDVLMGKPDPEGYLKAAGALGCDPASTLVFEDAPSGIDAALASGARVIVVDGLATGSAKYPVHKVTDFRGVAIGLCDDGTMRVSVKQRLKSYAAVTPKHFLSLGYPALCLDPVLGSPRVKQMSLICHDTKSEAQAALVERLMSVLDEEDREIRLAFAGGHTPEESYVALRQCLMRRADVVGRLKIFVTDDTVGSDVNRRMIENALCRPLGIRCYSPSAPELIESVDAEVDPLFHAVVLGLGHDGHTAGLFSAADSRSTKVVLWTVAPSGEQRITLGLKALGQAQRIFILATGSEKADAVFGIFNGAQGAGGIVGRWPQTTCLVDSQAARLIHGELEA